MSKEQNNLTINPTREQLYRFTIQHCKLNNDTSPQEMERFAEQIVAYDHEIDRKGTIVLDDPQQIQSWNSLVESNFSLKNKA